MSHPPPLRCEIRRPPPELGWLKWCLAAMVVVASLLDALWLIPAQREAARRQAAQAGAELRGYRCRELPAPSTERRVDGIYLGAPPTTR